MAKNMQIILPLMEDQPRHASSSQGYRTTLSKSIGSKTWGQRSRDCFSQQVAKRVPDSPVRRAGTINYDLDDDEVRKRQDDTVDVEDLTAQILKMCKVVRSKNYGSKALMKRSGVVCGARNGSKNVTEPVIVKNKQRLSESLNCKEEFKSVLSQFDLNSYRG